MLGRIHFDLIHIQEAYNGDKWVTHFYLDGIRLHVAYTHPKKNGCQEAVSDFISYAKNWWKLPVRAFRSDNERSAGKAVEDYLKSEGIITEYSVPGTPEMNAFAERSGGVIIERARALLLESRLPKNLWPEAIKAAVWILNRSPTKLQDGRWIIPYQEMLRHSTGVPAPINLSNLRVYGCRAYVKMQGIPQSDKMSLRAEIGYLVGFTASNIWRVWMPHENRVRAVRDVVFDENIRYDPKQEKKPSAEKIIEVMPYLIPHEELDEIEDVTARLQNLVVHHPEACDPQASEVPGAVSPSEKDASMKTQITQLLTPSPSQTPSVEPTSDRQQDRTPGSFPVDIGPQTIRYEAGRETQPSGIDVDDVDDAGEVSDSGQQLQTELESTPEPHLSSENSESTTMDLNRAPRDIVGDITEDNIIQNKRNRKKKVDSQFVSYFAYDEDHEDSEITLAAFSAGLSAPKPEIRMHRDDLPPPPDGWKEMVNHPYSEGFMAACALELETLKKKGTFDVVPTPYKTQILPLRWVFTYKFDSDGHLEKLKARICVRGDLQMISNEEKRAATLAARTARALFALVAAFDLDTWQADAVTAFLNSMIDEDVYTRMPEGFGKPGVCWKLLRALYGLRKSPRLWQKEATRILLLLGFEPVPEELCLFVKDGIIIIFYVDDIIMASHPSKREEAAEIRRQLHLHWELRDMGEAAWFLGIRIIRDRSKMAVWLCQDSYVASLATKYNLTGGRRYETPLPPGNMTPYTGKATDGQIHEFQGKIGSSLYATCITRPDAAKAVATLSQFASNPGPQHLEAINRVIGYLDHTRHRAICYQSTKTRPGTTAVSFASDASYGDNQDRKSSEGFLIQLFGGPVDWKATKQKTVTLSTTEAEFLALTEAGKAVYWWKRLFEAVKFNPEQEIEIQCDNEQTVGLLTKDEPQLRTKLRHVDISRHWLRQEVQEGNLHVRWVPTAEMGADGLTKLLPTQKHQNFVRQLGMEDINHLITLG